MATTTSGDLDRQLAMSILMNGGASASEAVKMARMQQQQNQQAGQSQQQHQQQLFQAWGPNGGTASGAPYSPDMVRLQRDLLNREIAARSGLPTSWTGSEAPYFIRAAALNAQQYPPMSHLFSQQMQGHSSSSFTSMPHIGRRASNSPSSSPSLKPDPDGAVETVKVPKKRGSLGEVSLQGSTSSSDTPTSQEYKKPRLALTFNPVSPNGTLHLHHHTNHHHRLSLLAPGPMPGVAPPPQMMPVGSNTGGRGRGAKAKLRDDFWGKVGKNNSHIHLVNIVLGRLLHQQVQRNIKKCGNKVLSNDIIAQILEHKLYGKYAVQDFFASANKAGETVRNTWTRLNFASDDIRKGLSRYKEQTWQAIERCDGFDEEELKKEDRKVMDSALNEFVQTGRFVSALDLALKGIITEKFMGVLMQLRLEWNSLCLNCRPEDHDGLVAAFLRKYGLNGK